VNYFSRLLDLGFEQDLSFILSTIKEHTSRKVQKVLLSATLSQGMTQTNLIKLSNESVFFMLERMYIVYTGQTF
jgi:superfamily II DNA/RNA helicase